MYAYVCNPSSSSSSSSTPSLNNNTHTVGGICVHAQTGAPQASQLGLSAGALLGLCAVAMSDMRDSELGELGVKGAWGESLWCGG